MTEQKTTGTTKNPFGVGARKAQQKKRHTEEMAAGIAAVAKEEQESVKPQKGTMAASAKSNVTDHTLVNLTIRVTRAQRKKLKDVANKRDITIQKLLTDWIETL